MTISPDKKLAWFVSAVVLAVVIGGVVYVGSPQQRRIERLDTTRANDLSSIAGYVGSEYGKADALPATLDDASMKASGYYVSSMIDPVTKEPYVYEPVSDTAFRLCATFDDSTLDADQTIFDDSMLDADQTMMNSGDLYTTPMKLGPGPDFARHPAGYYCFDLDARLMAPFVACGLRNPCQEGSRCVALPGEPSAVCVPSGYECQAARCASDSCVIAESYPAQVRCTEDSPAAAPKLPGGDCMLMQSTETTEIACFGCANGICTTPTEDFVPYAQMDGQIGIPYACYAAPTGCALAQ